MLLDWGENFCLSQIWRNVQSCNNKKIEWIIPQQNEKLSGGFGPWYFQFENRNVFGLKILH